MKFLRISALVSSIALMMMLTSCEASTEFHYNDNVGGYYLHGYYDLESELNENLELIRV